MLTRKYILTLHSKIVFNHLENYNKIMFRKLEVNSKRKITLQLHLQFSMTCIKENLLPVYTNIYIYIYIFHRINQLIIIIITVMMQHSKPNLRHMIYLPHCNYSTMKSLHYNKLIVLFPKYFIFISSDDVQQALYETFT